MNLKAKHVFFGLCFAFLLYSFSIYLKPLSVKPSEKFNVSKAANGRLVWQKYNCQACHQLYGLGGYLGPDLTNGISKASKGETFMRTMIRFGTKQMPAYNLSPDELEQLMEFFRSTDASGNADPRNYEINSLFMIEQKQMP